MYAVGKKRFNLYFIAAIVSIIFSIWAPFNALSINPDGVCYLAAASSMNKGLEFASHICDQSKWPFYSMLIYAFSKLFHISYVASAYIIDGFFSLISVLMFIAITALLTKEKRIVMLSACVILLAHEFNNARVELIRDHGYWAFYLLSLFFMLRYFASTHNKLFSSITSWTNALFWSISLIIATLFRIEGVVFLLLLPFVSLIDGRKNFSERLKSFTQLNGLTLLGGLILLTWVISHPHIELGRLPEIKFQLMNGLAEFHQAFQHTVFGLKTAVLNVFSAHSAPWIAIGMLVTWYMFTVIFNVTPIYAALIIYAWYKNNISKNNKGFYVLGAYIFVNILITLIFLIENMFLSKRYLVALSLVLMFWVAFGIEELIQQYGRRRWPLILAVILILIYGFGGIVDFNYYKHLYLAKMGGISR